MFLKGGFIKSWNYRIFKLKGISEYIFLSFILFRWRSGWVVQCLVLGHRWYGPQMVWTMPELGALDSSQGFIQPALSRSVCLVTHRCSLVKLTSTRCPLESLSAVPYCFPLCCKCKPDSHALSSWKGLIGCRRWILTQAPTLAPRVDNWGNTWTNPQPLLAISLHQL